MTTASTNSSGIGTRISAANAKPSMTMICTVRITGPTLRWPNRSNRRAYSGVTAAVASTYAALITPAIVQLSYMWLSASTIPRPIMDIGSRAMAPDTQNAFVPGMRKKLRVWRLRFLRFVRFVRLRLRFRARHAVTFPR